MKISRLSFAIIAVAGTATHVFAGSGPFVLNADAHSFNVNDGSSFVTDPQSATIASAPGTAHVTSTAVSSDSTNGSITGIQEITASLTDATTGSIRYQDSWDSTAPSAQVNFWTAISSYTFDTAAPASLNVTYTAILTGTGAGVGNFGMYNILLNVDGVEYRSPSASSAGWATPDAAGSWAIPLSAGAHTIQFQDWGNIWGGLGTRYDKLDETLNFSVGASTVPEPGSFLLLGFGLVPSMIRRRNRK